ncbi:helix-turn-helix domain-containing protein [Pseudarthrobacter sp. Y6]|uniref:helix-turn-helix domain-containing protein n=1 Tax=Pseudarthrobacter sp. Y6 TaxID=3418422 RepID=UPI003CF201DC
MAQWSEGIAAAIPEQPATIRFPKMLTLEDVRDVLNVGMPAVRAMVTSGELRGLQLSGGRRMWRVSEDDLAAYVERCYQETQERIAAGTIKADAPEGDE